MNEVEVRTSFFLSEEEVRELTKRKQRSAQVKVLRSMGVDHLQRPDGSVAILRAHIQELLGAAPKASRSTKKTATPQWDAI